MVICKKVVSKGWCKESSTIGLSRPGNKPCTSRSRRAHSTYCATEAGRDSYLVDSLYPRHLCRGVYSFRLSVRMFVRSYFLPSRGICVKVLRQSFSSGVYLSNYSSESIHIWTIVTLEGWHSLHDHGPQGPCPGVGLEVKI